jgi:hypothetical protein
LSVLVNQQLTNDVGIRIISTRGKKIEGTNQ